MLFVLKLLMHLKIYKINFGLTKSLNLIGEQRCLEPEVEVNLNEYFT